jgi:hypothetical protein
MDSFWYGFLVGGLVFTFLFNNRFRHAVTTSIVWTVQHVEKLLQKADGEKKPNA